jgi:hypothetical protein
LEQLDEALDTQRHVLSRITEKDDTAVVLPVQSLKLLTSNSESLREQAF